MPTSQKPIRHLSSVSRHSAESGYVTLMTVLIMTAVGVAVGTALLQLGIANIQTSQTISQANEAAALAEACAEDALHRLRLDSAATTASNLTLGNGSCVATITNGGGENRTIEASGSVASVTRKVEVSVDQLTPELGIASWQEVGDF